MFAAIYHPVGLAIVTMKWKNTGMRIAVNGVWGNLGVAAAALITGYLIDFAGWQMAFILPGAFSILMGVCYMALRREGIRAERAEAKKDAGVAAALDIDYRSAIIRVAIIVFVTAAVGSTIFQSTTFALPKIFDERLQGLAVQLSGLLESLSKGNEDGVATVIGSLAFVVFAVASLAQVVVGACWTSSGEARSPWSSPPSRSSSSP